MTLSDAATMELDAATLRRLRRNLRSWYARHGRALPWRESTDPYRIWISEIMLQQTTVVAVIPYFERFLGRFPDVQTLAAAPEEDVLRHWEGLGYYSRARNIHRTARLIADEQAGRFPDDPAALVQLPGIGRYTAGAIASFAFDRPAPIVEANTLRLYCRLLGYEGDPRSTAGQTLLWDFATRLVPEREPGHFNQALMDLGATVCTPQNPDCPDCPLKTCCRAFAEGSQSRVPLPKERPAVTVVTEATLAIAREGRFLLRRRQPGERWAGLWDFPRFPLSAEAPLAEGRVPPRAVCRELKERTREQVGLVPRIGEYLTSLKHGVTRYRITLHCFMAKDGGEIALPPETAWVSPGDFEQYPLSTTGRKLARRLIERCDQQSLNSGE